MRYFDTSFLVPLILPEATSEPIAAFLDGLQDEELAVSDWTRVEFMSLLAREVRMKGLNPEAAREAGARFESMVSGTFVILLPRRSDFDQARAWLGRFETGLRAGDALHLAVASNNKADAVHTLDKRMIEAAKQLGLSAGAGISLSGYET